RRLEQLDLVAIRVFDVHGVSVRSRTRSTDYSVAGFACPFGDSVYALCCKAEVLQGASGNVTGSLDQAQPLLGVEERATVTERLPLSQLEAESLEVEAL